MTVTNKEGYATKSTDFKSQLTKIINSNPDVLMIPVYYNDVALIVVQAKAHGLKAKLLGADGWDGVLEVIDKSNVDALANAYFCSQYSATDPNPRFRISLRSTRKYNKDANMFAVLGYDSMYILRTQSKGRLDRSRQDYRSLRRQITMANRHHHF